MAGSKLPRKARGRTHGAFSESVILPGEDIEEFEQLLDSLFTEWQPAGPVEADAVLSLGKALWRKQRLSIFFRAKKAYAEYGKLFAENYCCDNDENRWMAETVVLRQIRHAFEMTMARLKASAASGLKADYREPLNSENETDREVQEVIVDLELAQLGEVISPEYFGKLLELEQRLDAAIDRAVRRLLQLKAMKPVVGLDKAPAKSRLAGSAVPYRPQVFTLSS
jgi:hypothetical protein